MLIYLNKDFKGVRKLLIFDRDGTLNYDAGYTYKLKDLRTAPNLNAISTVICKSDFGFAIASNQSGIARALFSFEESLQFTTQLARLICPDLSHWLGYVCCPHIPEENCVCRKPSGLMLETILTHSLLPKADSVFFGNSEVDAGAAWEAKIEFRHSDLSSVARNVESWFSDVSN
jgi:histidinol-phosphate phosphatase family protein